MSKSVNLESKQAILRKKIWARHAFFELSCHNVIVCTFNESLATFCFLHLYQTHHCFVSSIDCRLMLEDLNDGTLADENVVADFKNDIEEYVGDNLVSLTIRVSHFYTFFELSLVLLTTHAHGL